VALRKRDTQTGIARQEPARAFRPRPRYQASSAIGRADAVVDELRTRGLSPLPWFDFFKSDRPPLQELEQLTLQVGGAILVATSDDKVVIRKRSWRQARDNVLFEYGLFAGALGRGKCGLLVPDRPSFRIPSDFLGVACFERYQENDPRRAVEAIVASLCAALTVPPRQDSLQSKARRLLQLLSWIRNEAFRLAQKWDNDPGQEAVRDRIVAVSAFVKTDIDSLNLRSEYDAIQQVILDAVDDFPRQRAGFDYEIEEAIRALVRGVPPNHGFLRGLLHFMERDECHRFRPLLEECAKCHDWWRNDHRFRYWYEDDYYGSRYRDYPFCGPFAWAAGAAEAATVFENAIRRADPMRPFRDWSQRYLPSLDESIAAFEKRLHEEIFGPL
jgi:hypothetical protein